MAFGEPRLVRQERRARRRRSGPLPPAPQGQALLGVPARGPGHQLVRAQSGRVAEADARAPQAAGRVLGEDGPAGRHPPLGLDGHQVRYPGPRREAPARCRGDAHRAACLRSRRPAAEDGLAAGRGRRRRVRRRPAALRLPGAAGQPLVGRRPQGLQPAVAPQHQEGREGRLSRSSRAATRTSPSGSACTRSPRCATTSGRVPCRISSACGRSSTPRTPTACGSTSRATTG